MKKSLLQLCTKDGLQTKNIEHIDVKFEVKQVREVEENGSEFYEFEGYGSTFDDVDLVNDVMLQGSFTESLRKRSPVLLWQHDMNMPLGIFVEVTEDRKGLYVKGRMPKEDTFVSGRVVPQMKVGSVRKMSIGFAVTSRDDYTIEDGIRYIKRVELYEISLVTIPANPNADVVNNVKNIDFIFNKKQISYRDMHQLLSSEFSNIVMEEYKDSNNRPYAYIVDIFQDHFIGEIEDKLYRYNYSFDENKNMPYVDPNRIEVRRETNYVEINSSKQSFEEKTEKQFTINDVFNIKCKRDFENILRESGMFSKSAATFISSFFQESQSDSVQKKNGNKTSLLDQIKSLNSQLEK